MFKPVNNRLVHYLTSLHILVITMSSLYVYVHKKFLTYLMNFFKKHTYLKCFLADIVIVDYSENINRFKLIYPVYMSIKSILISMKKSLISFHSQISFMDAVILYAHVLFFAMFFYVLNLIICIVLFQSTDWIFLVMSTIVLLLFYCNLFFYGSILYECIHLWWYNKCLNDMHRQCQRSLYPQTYTRSYSSNLFKNNNNNTNFNLSRVELLAVLILGGCLFVFVYHVFCVVPLQESLLKEQNAKIVLQNQIIELMKDCQSLRDTVDKLSEHNQMLKASNEQFRSHWLKVASYGFGAGVLVGALGSYAYQWYFSSPNTSQEVILQQSARIADLEVEKGQLLDILQKMYFEYIPGQQLHLTNLQGVQQACMPALQAVSDAPRTVFGRMVSIDMPLEVYRGLNTSLGQVASQTDIIAEALNDCNLTAHEVGQALATFIGNAN